MIISSTPRKKEIHECIINKYKADSDSTGVLGGVATKYLIFFLGKSVMDICHEKIIVEQYAAMI